MYILLSNRKLDVLYLSLQFFVISQANIYKGKII